MSLQDIPLPSPPPDSSLRGHMSGLFSRGIADKIASNVFSDPLDSETDPAGRKRVGFHPWTTNILEPQLSTPNSEVPPSLKSLPPSRDCQLTVRPILKPSLSSQSVLGLDGQNETISSLETMDSLLRNLAVNERSSSVDAYQTMTSLIRTYDEAPEQDILQKKTTQLQKYIKRDLTVLDVPIDNQPSEERLSMGNLIVSALKVLVTMVWSPAYSPYLTDDFRVWSVDRAIRVLKDHLAPKAVLLHYMHLLATQNFRSSIITQTRVQRILEALQELTEHISGKAVVAERLLVYQKMMQQSRQVMKARPDMWVKNMFTAMGHSFKEVRTNALSAGTEACNAYSASGSMAISVAARAALAEVTGDRTLSASITNRLERVLAAKDEANQIPQIWTIILLLCNGGQQKLDSWQQLPDWLKLIQRCFNSSDMTVRIQAFLAWNRLYWVARPHEASEKVVSMLAKPAMVQLERFGNNQSSKGTRQAVISSYCMLMYYAFRPSASPSQYTRMWNEFVVKLMTRSFLAKSGSNCDLSCRILAALFYSSLSKTRVWNENRANENASLDPLELPAIDCKWVRSKTASILSIFQLVVDYSSFGPSGSISEQAYAPQAWRNLMQAIKESTSKEITPSADTKLAFASIVNFLRPASGDDDQSSANHPSDKSRRLSLLAKIAVDELGLPSMLQAVENATVPVNTIIIKSLVEQSLQVGDDLFSQQDRLINRCLRLLDADLESVGRVNSSLLPSTRCLVLEYSRYALEMLAHYQPVHTLSTLQRSIIHLVEDVDQQFPEDVDAEDNPTEYWIFCNTVFNLLNSLELTKQEELSKLISAATSSTHAWLRELLPSHLNGSAQHADPSEGVVAQHTSPIQVQPTSLPNLQKDEQAQTVKSRSGRKSTSSETASTSSKSRKGRKKPRHDDSQIEFVAVESSPPDYAFESQLLTTRQKEVRARQIAEPAVTFANIRSSPSVGKKGTPKSDKKAERSGTPELPGTPTLPAPCDNEDEDQPPTPTPRRRRSRRLDLQPEITSSPPSVVGDSRNMSSMNITSSPVKDVTEADDAISFEEVDNEAIVVDPEEDIRPQIALANQRSSSEQIPDEVTPMDYSAPKGSTGEEYETAQAARSSPTTYSDEYDALAASQLSHSLEETSFITSRLGGESTPEPPRANRKRKGEQRESSSGKRRRRGSVEKSSVVESGGDLEDTIYVTVEKATPSSSRVTRARAAQEASDLSQMSQKSSASTTPKARKSTGSRRRGRPRKKPVSASSRDSSPSTRVQIPAVSLEEPDDGVGKADDEMTEIQDMVGSPSLGSEVAETAESKASSSSQVEKVNALVTNDMTVEGEDGLTTESKRETGGPVAEAQAELPERSSAMPMDVVSNLQTVLDMLNNNPSVDVELSGADLATIHSLCFKIGLKAQDLASR